jgi:hypothetical protein
MVDSLAEPRDRNWLRVGAGSCLSCRALLFPTSGVRANGMKDACELACALLWTAGAQGPGSRPQAVSVTVSSPTGHKTLLYLVPPAPGVLRAGAGAVGAALCITALVAGGVLARQNHRRARMSTVSFAGPSCHLSRTKRNHIWRAPGRSCHFGSKIVSGFAREAAELRADSA